MATTCCICLCSTAESSDKDWCALSSCGHTFHEDCLLAAIHHADNPRCPQCRETICQRTSDRDRTVLRRNHVLSIRLDVSGHDGGSPSQPSLSPASDRLKRELVAVRAECRALEGALHQQAEARQQELVQLKQTLEQTGLAVRISEDQLIASRKELHIQKQQFTRQLKDERSKRQSAEARAEGLQAAVDKHELLSNPGLPRPELLRIAQRHLPAAEADVFADAMVRRNELTARLLSEKEREAAKAEQQRRRSEQLLSERDGLIQQLQGQLQTEQEARQAADWRAPAAAAAAGPAQQPPTQGRPPQGAAERPSAAGQPWQDLNLASSCQPFSSPPEPPDASGRTAEAAQAAAQPAAADEEWLDLDDEEAGVENTAPQPPPRHPTAAAAGPSFLQGAGGRASFLGGSGPRGLAELSFMRGGACTSTSGSFIREGPDGRGGRVKILVPSTQPRPFTMQQKRGGSGGSFGSVPAIKRRKGPSARGGQAITIQHFFDAAEQDAGHGEDGGPAQRRAP